MKRLLIILLTLILIPTLTVQAFAYEYKPVDLPIVPKLDIDWSKIIKIPDSFWDQWFDEHQLPDIEVPDITNPVIVELDVPIISTAKYVHKTSYYGQNKHLEIFWDEIDNAEYYEILIKKADGETISYTATNNFVYINGVECPKVYVEATSTWTAATVQIRAVAEDVYSEWSEAIKISCDAIH